MYSLPAWAEKEVPEAPASRIHDVVSLFDRDHEAFDRISLRLREIQGRHGIPVYLAVYSSLMFQDAASHGRFLFNRWVGEGEDGVLILYEVDFRKAYLVVPMDELGMGGAASETRLPEYDLAPIVRELDALAPEGADRIAFLDRYTSVLGERLDELLAEEAGASPLKFAVLILAIGAALGGVGFFLRSTLRDSAEKPQERNRFPEVEIETRLGASHGGARVNVLSYRSGETKGDSSPSPEASGD